MKPEQFAEVFQELIQKSDSELFPRPPFICVSDLYKLYECQLQKRPDIFLALKVKENILTNITACLAEYKDWRRERCAWIKNQYEKRLF